MDRPGGDGKELRVAMTGAPDGRKAVLLTGPWDLLDQGRVGDTIEFTVTGIEREVIDRG